MDYSKMTLREKVLQTFVVTIREINTHGGPAAFFEKYPVGGMYYSYQADTVGTTEMGTGTNPARLAECRAASRLPLFVCADGVAFPGQTVGAPTTSAAATRDIESAYRLGRICGMQMNAADVDWVLTPMVDLLYNREMPLYACTDDPALCAAINRAFVQGVQAEGVCATIKHFPGIGTCNINMHFGPGRNDLPFDEWMESYGLVYRTCIKAGVMSVMTTHMTLRSYDDEGDRGYYPIATYSKKLTTDLLKGELGFGGAVVTDALIMGGMATGDLIEETVQAFRAGADFLLWPPVEAADRIVELLESGEIPMSRLEDALARIESMRAFREEGKRTPHPTSLEYVEQNSRAILKSGICLLRNRLGLIPLDPAAARRMLIVDASDSGTAAANLQKALGERGVAADVKRMIYDVPSRVCWQADFDALAADYDCIIFAVDTDYVTSWSVPYMLIWASHLFDKKKKIIVNYGSPFFADSYFPEDPTYIETNAPGSPYCAECVADILLGRAEATGKHILLHPHL